MKNNVRRSSGCGVVNDIGTISVKKKNIIEAMKVASDCSAWPVAIMLARIIDDFDSANRYADKLVERMAYHIAVVERTQERLAEEKKKILNDYYYQS